MRELVAAGFALMILSGGAGYWLRGSDSTPPLSVAVEEPVDADLGTNASSTPTPLPVQVEQALLEYEASVQQLETTLAELADRLDPEALETIEGNLYTIDQAIYEARVALGTDPQSEYLNAHLADSMMRKVRVLRQATRLASSRI